MRQKQTRHHIVPKSRGGDNSKDNIKHVVESKHRAYHTLFGNALPEEAVMILLKKWWYKNDDTAQTKLWALAGAIDKMIDEE